MSRRLALHAVSFVLLLGLCVFLFWVPLRPVAWGGPRESGPFEEEDLSAAGWVARDARLVVERFATWRSPGQPLAATAEALLGVHGLLAVGRFAILWLLLRRIGGAGWLATVGVVAAALPTILGGPRHDDWDFGLLPFVTLMAATTPARVPWGVAVAALPVLFAVGVNVHASAVVGLAWLAVITVGRSAEWWQGRRAGSPERPAVGRLLLAVPLCVAATGLNPDGFQIYPDAIGAARSPNIHGMPEWQPVDFSTSAGMPWAYFATLAVLLLAQLASRWTLGPTRLVVLLSFGFWPVTHQRGLETWWLIVPWLAVPLVASAVRRVGGGPEPGAGARAETPDSPASAPAPASGSDSSDHLEGARWPLRAAILAAVVALLTTPLVRWLVLGPRALVEVVSADTPARLAQELTASETDAERYLPELRQVLQAHYPDGRYRGAILTGERQGDFLAWVLDGDNTRPVMVYSRPVVLESGTWGEAHSALEGNGDWWEVLGRHQVNLIAIPPGRWEKLAGLLRHSPAWAIVEDGPALLVAVRREPKLPAELQP